MFRRPLASTVLAAFALTGAHAAPSDALKLHGMQPEYDPGQDKEQQKKKSDTTELI